MVNPTDYVHPADRIDMTDYERGMQLRTYIAVQMAAALRARGSMVPASFVARAAIADADALIAELNK